MAKFIIGIGIPGSGKTTYLKSFAKKFDYSYISSDDVLQEITGGTGDMTKYPEVWSEIQRRIVDELNKGNTVVLDSTMYKPEDRLKFTSFARENGATKIQGVYLDVPVEVATERNLARDKGVVGERVIERMDNKLHEFPPSITDGIDSLFILDQFGELKEVKIDTGEGELRKELKLR